MDRHEIEAHWNDKRNWTWGVLYHCSEDPRPMVPRRWRWGGWTLNFGHPKAGRIGAGALVLVLAPPLLAFFALGDATVGIVAMGFSIIAVAAWAHWESTRPR